MLVFHIFNLLYSFWCYRGSDPGTYIFSDAALPSKLTTVVVLARATVCPTSGGARIVGTSSDNLVMLGVQPNSNLTIEPDLLVCHCFVNKSH